MDIVWGIVLITFGLLAWGGQTLSWLIPETAARLGLAEAENEVEPLFWADIRGEAAWDALTLWTLVVAGILLAADVQAWAYFGLVAGGIYLYFAGRGILTRLEMLRRGFRIGKSGGVRMAMVVLGVWGVIAGVTIVLAVLDLA